MKTIYGECVGVNHEDGLYLIHLETSEGKVYVTADEDNIFDDIMVGRHYLATGEDNSNAHGLYHANYVDRWGRYCDHCGKHHTEGYYVREHEYACSAECGYALCGGKAAFEETIWLDADGELADNSPTYWTEWEA